MKEENNISRRKALKILGLGAAATVGAAVFKSTPFLANAYAQSTKASEFDTNSIKLVDKKLNYRNNDMISMIGFGCMRFPTTGDGGRRAPVDIEKTQQLVDYAYAHGINYYDTAYVYHGGKSEEIIGNALRKYPRESYFLADKMPGYNVKVKEDVPRLFEEQLKRCGVDYFDYYLLHTIQDIKSYEKVYEEFGGYEYLLGEKKKGRIKNLGFSFHGNRECWDHVIDKHDWDFVQIQLNYIDWDIDGEYLYKSLEKRKIPCVIMEPLLGGRLASLSKGAEKILKEKNPDLSIASWAFRYLGSLPNVLVSLSGMTYMEHLVDNVKTFTEFKKLNAGEKLALNRAIIEYNKFKRINCTACRYCMPCPYDVEIPSVFTVYNKLVMDSNIPSKEDQSAEEYATKREAFAKAFREEFASGGNATQCVGCGECLEKCPQHLQIPDLMELIKKPLEG